MGHDREYNCPNCGAAIRTAMIRCRECGELVLNEELTLENSSDDSAADAGFAAIVASAASTEDESSSQPDQGPADAMILEMEPDDSAPVEIQASDDQAKAASTDDADTDVRGSETQAPDTAESPAGPASESKRERIRRLMAAGESIPLLPAAVTVCAVSILVAGFLLFRGIMRSSDPADMQLATVEPTATPQSSAVEPFVEDSPEVSESVAVQSNDALIAVASETVDIEVPETRPDAESVSVAEPVAVDAAVPQRFESRDALVAKLIEQVERSVVTIHVVTEDGAKVTGSGFLCRNRNTVVTNFHVIEAAISATVRFIDGTESTVTGFEVALPKYDLAVIQTQDSFPDSEPLKLNQGETHRGSDVFAFGAPRGLSGTVTSGLVSAVREFGKLADGFEEASGKSIRGQYDDASVWVQTTAPISSGNSGGPLVLLSSGDVVGMNSWYLVDGQNLNFALAAADIARFLPQASTPVRSLVQLPQQPKAPVAKASSDDKWLARIRAIDVERIALLNSKALVDTKLNLAEQLYGRCEVNLVAAQSKLQATNQDLAQIDSQAAQVRRQLGTTVDALARTSLQRQFDSLATTFRIGRVQSLWGADYAAVFAAWELFSP